MFRTTSQAVDRRTGKRVGGSESNVGRIVIRKVQPKYSTAQLLGGTIGMALCGTLLAMTGDYRVVFLTAGMLAMVVLVIAWFTVERPDGAWPIE